MKKINYDHFGGVDVLTMTDSPVPEIMPDQLLVRVKAVSINPLDWKIRNGEMKLMTGTIFPKDIGIDFSGVIEKVGNTASKFKTGDAVFGSVDVFKKGALAEYIAISPTEIALKPDALSFEQAAAIPIAGTAALQIFDKLAPLHKETEVLINGASGGIGMFAIQLAKRRGARVTSVVSSKSISLVEKWGSDVVINYQEENVLGRDKQYDAVIDLSGKMPFHAAKAIMKPASVYVNTIPGPKEIIGSFVHNLFSTKKYRVLLLKPSSNSLERLAAYASQGVEVFIGSSYPITRFKEGYEKASKGGVVGKWVFTV
jgi:NADPH:quinone reductase-like Zn-dependent oxidoreductase